MCNNCYYCNKEQNSFLKGKIIDSSFLEQKTSFWVCDPCIKNAPEYMREFFKIFSKKSMKTNKTKNNLPRRVQSPEPDHEMPSSPMPSARAGVKPIGTWNLSASQNHIKNAEDEWSKILKACKAPVGFTHNDLSLYPKKF